MEAVPGKEQCLPNLAMPASLFLSAPVTLPTGLRAEAFG